MKAQAVEHDGTPSMRPGKRTPRYDEGNPADEGAVYPLARDEPDMGRSGCDAGSSRGD